MYHPRAHLANEAYALLGRLHQTEPFSLTMPMVSAASVSKPVLRAITLHWEKRRKQLAGELHKFIAALKDEHASEKKAHEWQSEFARLKLRFNSLLDQFDIFADVVSQRAEHKVGIWVAGLDELAADALRLNTELYRTPPLMCFLERGHGAAIRKARARLPGGDENPVAIIQVPRERLVGSGIASSIIHEAGHQGVALLQLLPSLRQVMNDKTMPAGRQMGWQMLRRWLSEILADFWAVGNLGIGATLGLMGVVGLPKYFMFRVKDDDPHPFPWIRVMISLAFGEKLFPDPQWGQLRQLWLKLYPLEGQSETVVRAVREVLDCLPVFTELVAKHQNNHTQGRALASLFHLGQRQPRELRRIPLLDETLANLPPSLAFAVVGQARADGRISNKAESSLLSRLLTHWARRRAE